MANLDAKMQTELEAKIKMIPFDKKNNLNNFHTIKNNSQNKVKTGSNITIIPTALRHTQ